MPSTAGPPTLATAAAHVNCGELGKQAILGSTCAHRQTIPSIAETKRRPSHVASSRIGFPGRREYTAKTRFHAAQRPNLCRQVIDIVRHPRANSLQGRTEKQIG